MSDDGSSEQDKSKKASAVGWDSLPNELLPKIIAHATSTSPAWEANKTLSSLARTSRRIHSLTQGKSFQEYKDGLDGGRIVSSAVKTFAVPGGKFSDKVPWWGIRHIGSEVAALVPALEFQSPAMRSQIFGSISTQGPEKRMLGYSCLVDRADLLKRNEVNHIEIDALSVFQKTGPEYSLEASPAADILAKRYDYIGDDARDQIHRAISADEMKMKHFGESIVGRNPSLLRHDEIRSLIRKEFRRFENEHASVAVLSSHIDKNSRADTDFIIGASYELWDRESCYGDEYRYPCPARAIASVFDGNISDEQRSRIAETTHSDTEEGQALRVAFKDLGRELPAELPVAHGPEQSNQLVLQVKELHGMADAVGAIEIAEEISKTNAAQVNAARKALLDSVSERDDRVR